MNKRQKRTAACCAGLVLLVAVWLLQRGARSGPWTRDEVLSAIRFVESSHRDVVPDGDGGKAIGPFQIHRIYWQDAVRFRPELGGRYEDCRRRGYAERVVAAYMEKWVPEAWLRIDAEVIARVHNGGPLGATKVATLGYWQRVQAQLP